MSKRNRAIHPYRLSEHAIQVLNTCERKFQLDRMLMPATYFDNDGESSPVLIRGTAFGAGVQDYLLHGDMEHACFVCWMEYYPEVYDEQKKIYLWRTINNLRCAQDELDKIRQRYTVAVFDGKPAAELSFRLDIDDKWYYVGYIDLVLFDKLLNIYVVLEIKTTAYKLIDLQPMYKNSGQALGYSIIIDKIVGERQSKYGVLYFVCRDQQGANFVPDIYTFPFTKTLLDRLRWFYTIGLDVQRLNTMLDNELFPMRGNSCVHFNRVCPHYGTCTLQSSDVPRKVEEDTNVYQFRYKLDEVIAEHIERVQEDQIRQQVGDIEHV